MKTSIQETLRSLQGVPAIALFAKLAEVLCMSTQEGKSSSVSLVLEIKCRRLKLSNLNRTWKIGT